MSIVQIVVVFVLDNNSQPTRLAIKRNFLDKRFWDKAV